MIELLILKPRFKKRVFKYKSALISVLFSINSETLQIILGYPETSDFDRVHADF